MLLRQDRFHIHPILCAKIVQGERKRKELVHFLFPSRSLYYQKIVQGERKTEQTERKIKFTSIFPRCSRFYQKRKELVHFLFPSRSLYYQKIVQGERKTEQTEPQPILSHIRNFRKIKNFSKRYYSLRSGTTTSSTTASGFGCDTSFFGLSRWSGNVYATDKLTFK